jgi:hypothetical protein
MNRRSGRRKAITNLEEEASLSASFEGGICNKSEVGKGEENERRQQTNPEWTTQHHLERVSAPCVERITLEKVATD